MRVPELWPCHGVLDEAHNGLDVARLAHAKLARPETRLDVGLEVLDNGGGGIQFLGYETI